MTPEDKQARKRDAARRWRHSHPDVVRAKKRRYYERHRDRLYAAGALKIRKSRDATPEGYLREKAKERAKKFGRDFDITAADIVIPVLCPVFGIPLRRAAGKPDDNSPSLDRIDNSKGYVKGNVCVISHKANSLKRHLTLDDLDRLRNYMLRNA